MGNLVASAGLHGPGGWVRAQSVYSIGAMTADSGATRHMSLWAAGRMLLESPTRMLALWVSFRVVPVMSSEAFADCMPLLMAMTTRCVTPDGGLVERT